MKYCFAILMMVLILLGGCQSDRKSKELNTSSTLSLEQLLEKGSEVTGSTFGVLSRELKMAMEEGGVPNAVKYCNLMALPITDSLSNLNNTVIKRTSDKVRNPMNAATEDELSILKDYNEKLKNQEMLNPIIKSVKGRNVYYAPILTNSLCLNCHGQKDEMNDYQSILDLYPKDLATGYKLGDLRGIWSVTFLK